MELRQILRLSAIPENMYSVFKYASLRFLTVLAGLMLASTMHLYASAPCRSIPGAAQLWSDFKTRWVWIGETHGTSEIPAAFGDLVCDALAQGRVVTVVLERPATEQTAIDGLISSSDPSWSENQLLNQPDWQNVFDGRTSKAMLKLLLRLRELKKEYPAMRVSAIVNFASASSDSQIKDDDVDKAIGRAVLALERKEPRNIVLVLTGNVHGMKSPVLGYKTAAMYLPSEGLVSLEVTGLGGDAWTMHRGACGPGPAGVRDKDTNRSLGIYLHGDLAPVGKVDGILALGEPTSASSPANSTMLEGAPCREVFSSRQREESSPN
ncbi:hypothetical protein FTW19_19985 [Terriglobus albidus]|uniref:ChaN family lipoprotein n=1 Tax=Terriglobus albidus TaxID=1592106 RepID=A0A5B9EGX1_9BACT|nr:hypothetical protein [Terriglobus albidus]QEE30060.1 hypothetical protein FTW19_19985 [Terriglobus albidus]